MIKEPPAHAEQGASDAPPAVFRERVHLTQRHIQSNFTGSRQFGTFACFGLG
jgi:hypothetical protein